MSAYLDSFSGAGYDGSDVGGIGDVGTSYTGERPFSESSAAQMAGSLAFGYLQRRLDIDLTRRLQGDMPDPQQRGNAPFVRVSGQGLPLAGRPDSSGPGLSLQSLLMLGAAAVAAVFLATG